MSSPDARGPSTAAGGGVAATPPGLDTTATLLGRARGGDRDAVDALCARYLPRLRRWARGRLPIWARDLIDTDDLVVDTLAETARHFASFEVRWDGAFQAFLREALRNRLRDEIRRVRRRPTKAELSEEEVDAGPSPLEEAVGREMVERYEAALGRLRDAEREAVVARIEMGCTYPEVADVLGKPSADAARMAVGRALVRLVEEMTRGG